MIEQRRSLTLFGLTILVALTCSGADKAEKEQDRTRQRRRDVKLQYDVLQQIHLPTFAQLITAKIEEGAAKDLAQPRPGESDEDFLIRKLFTESLVAALSRSVREVEDVKLGWKLDRQERRALLDLELAVPRKTALDRQLSDAATLETRFAGFLRDGAAIRANWLGQSPPADAAAHARLVDAVRDKAVKDIEREAVSADEQRIRKEIVGNVFAVLRQTAASGRCDGALSIQLVENRITLVAGGYLSDGARLEQALKPVGQFLQMNHPAFADLKLDAESFAGVNLHTLSIPAPQGNGRDKFLRMFGERLEMVVAFGKEAVYFAAGREAMAALKEALDTSQRPARPDSPLAVSLAIKPLADFVAVMGKGADQSTAQEISLALADTPGKAEVRLTTLLRKRAITFRLEAEEGILRWIGRAHPQLGRLLLEKQ